MIFNRYSGLLAVAVGTALLQSGDAANYMPPTNGYTISVTSTGALCNGVHDDTPGIMTSINQAAANPGGGIVLFPAGTCLLNSFSPSPHPWMFRNLLIPSNVFLQGSTTGTTTLLQGPNGRQYLANVPGAAYIRNSVVVFGTADWESADFTYSTKNGGFYNLNSTTAGSSTVMLAITSQISNFHVGDYVAIYDGGPPSEECVCPAEASQITAINSGAGQITLNWPLARSFSNSPVIADVTGLETFNQGMANLTVQGEEPLTTQQTFNTVIQNSHFIADNTITGTNYVKLANLGTMRDWAYSGNTADVINGSNVVYFECPERDSQTGIITGNTFNVANVSCGEYLAHWQVTNNTFNVIPPSSGPGSYTGVAFSGLDVLFQNNTVNGTNNTANQIPIFSDWAGVGAYAPYVGQIQVIGNVFNCNNGPWYCTVHNGPDTVVMYNSITNSAVGGGAVQMFSGTTVRFESNSVLTTDNAPGYWSVLLDNGSVSVDGETIHGNYIYDPNGGTAIYVANPPSPPNTGGDLITDNCFAGTWTTTVNINMTNHPGTFVTADKCRAPVFGHRAASGQGGVRWRGSAP
jgi:hypothetical protein